MKILLPLAYAACWLGSILKYNNIYIFIYKLYPIVRLL
jgi:hypothetical protein